DRERSCPVKRNARISLPTQEDVRADLRGVFLRAIQVALTAVLDEELERMIGAARGERSGNRRDERNGSYSRGLLPSMGQVDLDVPRSRKSGSSCSVIGRYKRRSAELDETICSAYVNGVSTRKMAGVTRALVGEGVGRSSVSRVTKRLGDAVEALRN